MPSGECSERRGAGEQAPGARAERCDENERMEPMPSGDSGFERLV